MSVDLYADAFYKKRIPYAKRAPIICQSIIEIWHAKSAIDAGCALGDLVGEFLNRQVEAIGIEGNPACLPYIQCPPECLKILDLSKPIDLGRRFDVAISLEVAEHIEEPYADVYVENICGFADVLVMSCCDYGATTEIHCNVKPRSYWIEKFNQRGYIQSISKEMLIKEKWAPIRERAAVKEAYRNLIIFEKK